MGPPARLWSFCETTFVPLQEVLYCGHQSTVVLIFVASRSFYQLRDQTEVDQGQMWWAGRRGAAVAAAAHLGSVSLASSAGLHHTIGAGRRNNIP